MYQGVWPYHDPWGAPYAPGTDEAIRAGKALASGYRGVVWVLKGHGKNDMNLTLHKFHPETYFERIWVL